MANYLDIDTSSVEVSAQRLRGVCPSTVQDLVGSIKAVGLLTPVSVRFVESEDGLTRTVLVCGMHRLEAVKQLGWHTVPAVVLPQETDGEARMAEIAENLHRAELTVLERAEHIAEWIRLTEERDAAQVAPHQPRKAGQQPGGINAATRELGIERTQAQRAVKIAEHTTAEAKEAAREVGLDKNQSALLAVAAVPPEQQVAKVQELAKEKAPDPNAAIERARKALYALSENQRIAVIADVTGLLIEDVAAMFRRGAP